MSDGEYDYQEPHCAIGKVTFNKSDPEEARNILMDALAALEQQPSASDADNVITFPKPDTDIPEMPTSDAILSRALEADLHTAVVIGANQDGGMYLSYASDDAPLIVFLLQLAMDAVINRVKSDHSD